MDIEPDPPTVFLSREEAATVLLELAQAGPVSVDAQAKNEMDTDACSLQEEKVNTRADTSNKRETEVSSEHIDNTKTSIFAEQPSLFSQSPSRFRQRRLPPPVINTAPGFYVPKYIESGNPMDNDQKLRRNSPPERVLVGYGRPKPSDSAPLPGEAAFLEEASSDPSAIPMTKPHSAPFFTPESWNLIPNDVVTTPRANITTVLMETLAGRHPSTPMSTRFNGSFSPLDEQSRTVIPRVLRHYRSELTNYSGLGYEGIITTEESAKLTTPFVPFSPTTTTSHERFPPSQSIWATSVRDAVVASEHTPTRHSSRYDSTMSGPTEIEELPEQPLRGGDREAATFAKLYQGCKVDLEILAELKPPNARDAIYSSVTPSNGQNEAVLTVTDRVQHIGIRETSCELTKSELGNLQGDVKTASDPFEPLTEGGPTGSTHSRSGLGPMIFGSMSPVNHDTLGLDLRIPTLSQSPKLHSEQFVYETLQNSEGDLPEFATNGHAPTSRQQSAAASSHGMYQSPANPAFTLNEALVPATHRTAPWHQVTPNSRPTGYLGSVRAYQEYNQASIGSRFSPFQSSPARAHPHIPRDTSVDRPYSQYSPSENLSFRSRQSSVGSPISPPQARFAAEALIRGGFYRRGRRPGATNVPGRALLLGNDEGGVPLGIETAQARAVAPAPVVWTERWHPESLRNAGVKPSPDAITAQLPDGLNPASYQFEAGGCFFCIKSKSEDDIRASVVHGIWSSTDKGNCRLDEQYRNQERTGPFLLIFAVNCSREICGIAEMISPVDFEDRPNIWLEPIYKGSFKVRWIFLKNVDYCNFSHIFIDILPGSMPATQLRDALPYRFTAGKEILKIYVQAPFLRNLFTHPKMLRSNWRPGVSYNPQTPTRGRGGIFGARHSQ